jgi:nicotinamidase-related amidase
MEAILVVDIDGANGWKYTPNSEMENVREAIEKALEKARRDGKPVLFVTMPRKSFTGQEMQLQKDPNNSECIGCNAWDGLVDFLKHRHESEFEPVFIKKDCDAFTNKNLIEHLRNIGIDEIALAGCFSFSCILFTTVGAVKNGFRVKLLEKCLYPRLSTREKASWFRLVKEEIPDADALINIRFE